MLTRGVLRASVDPTVDVADHQAEKKVSQYIE
jgi:hypothetical protein